MSWREVSPMTASTIKFGCEGCEGCEAMTWVQEQMTLWFIEKSLDREQIERIVGLDDVLVYCHQRKKLLIVPAENC